MKTEVIKEQPIYYNDKTHCGGCNLDCPPSSIEIYMDELIQAKIGHIWSTQYVDDVLMLREDIP